MYDDSTLPQGLCYSETGSIGYKSSGKMLVDINFAISSMRNMNESNIIQLYVNAFNENNLLAVKWLFYARDCRSGAGERRLFRIIFDYLVKNHQEIARAVLKFIPEYGRWDDLIILLKGDLSNDVFNIIENQLKEDKENMKNNKSISLCAKWMPSINTSSTKTKNLARILIKKMKCNEKQYRKTLSQLRSFLKVVEVSMSAKKWDEINYEAVPSKANLIYNKAFLKNDTERRKVYLEKLNKGEAKINAHVLFPHDIVNKYENLSQVDDTLEALWKNLPDYVKGNGNTLCVVDSSGSMKINATPKSTVTCMQVAYSLAVYFAERSSGRFRERYITFSSRPTLIDLSKGNNLKEKLDIINEHCFWDCDNTNIEAVFNLILDHAIKYSLPQEELPANILVLSDLEFDAVVDIGTNGRPDDAFFVNMMKKYEEHGYLLPRLVFWNINSRTRSVPLQKNSLGVALVSGFSPAIAKMVLSSQIDPYECLLEQLNSERYQAIEDALKDIIKK